MLGMVYVETAWCTDGRLVPPDTGTLMPMLASAMGRAWLSGAGPAEREAVLNRMRVQDPHVWAGQAAAARRSVEAFPRVGYCWSRDVRRDVEAFRVPLARPIDGVRYALNWGVLARSPLPKSQARAVGIALAEIGAAMDAG